MLDTKDIKILNRIFEKRKWKNIKELLKELNFTRGDFNYHLQHINFFLKNNKISQIDVGQYDEKLIVKIQEGYNNLESNLEIVLDGSDRILILGILLVVYKTLKLEDIKNLLNISINTSFLDIQSLVLYLKNNFSESIKIISTFKGYTYVADEFTIRKFIINMIIQLVNSENYEVLKRFIFKSLPSCTLINNNSFAILEKIILKYYYLLEYIHVEFKTLTFVIFILLHRDIGKIIFSKIKGKTEKTSFYEKQKSYEVAKKIINEIELIFNFNFVNKKFEEFYLSNFLFSPEQHIICENSSNEFIEIILYLNLLIQKFEEKGYQFNVPSMLFHLSKYLNWVRHSWDINLIFDYSFNIKKKIFLNNYRYNQFFILFKNLITDIKIIIKKDLNINKEYELALQFLPHIIKYPSEQNFKIKSILITNKKGGLINVLVLKINELFPNFEIIKIVNWNYFNSHQEKYLSLTKISCDPEILDFEKSAYLNINILEKQENSNNLVFQLIGLILDSGLADYQKIIEIKRILKNNN